MPAPGTCLTSQPTAARAGTASRTASLMIPIFSRLTSIRAIVITSLLLLAAVFMKLEMPARTGRRCREFPPSHGGHEPSCNIHQFPALYSPAPLKVFGVQNEEETRTHGW